jgi:hypothetical protein
LRFGVALLVVAVALGAMTLPIVHQPGVIEFGFAAFFFCGAIETTARMVYFHRRRRQIQIEDGTWEEFDLGSRTRPAELLAGLIDKTSKANRYAAIAAVFGLLTCVIVTATLMMRAMAGGHWIAVLLILLWGGFASFRWLRNWRQTPRRIFDARFGKLVKFVGCYGVFTLLLIDLSWARGRLPLTSEWAIAFNIAVVLAYAALIGVVARLHRQPAAPPNSTSTSTQ